MLQRLGKLADQHDQLQARVDSLAVSILIKFTLKNFETSFSIRLN